MTLPAIVLIVAMQATAGAAQPPTAGEAAKALADANALFEQLDNEKALAAYDRAVELDPKNPAAFLGRGRTLARLRRYGDAIAAYGEAIRLNPQDAFAFRDRGHACLNQRRLECAVEDLVKAESMNQGDYGIYYHLALARYVEGDFGRAAAAYEGCVRTAPTDENRLACYGWRVPTLMRLGRTAEAATLLDTALALPVKPDAAYLDRLKLLKGTLTEQQVAETMGKGALEQATAGYSLGLWHLLNGRTDRAREYFTKATGSDATYAFGAVAADAELKRLK